MLCAAYKRAEEVKKKAIFDGLNSALGFSGKVKAAADLAKSPRGA